MELKLLILVVDLDDCTFGKYSCIYADVAIVLSSLSMRTKLELDWLILLGIVLLNLEELEYIEAGYCVHADVVVVDILVKLLVFHEEEPVKQFGSTEAETVVTVALPTGAEFIEAPPEEKHVDVELVVLLHW